jgi:hypothetical protein
MEQFLLTSHRPSGVPSPAEPTPSRRGPEEILEPGGTGGREFSRDSLRTRLLALSLYSLSSSWTKCVSSSPGLTVTPHTGQQDGSDWNFFLPGSRICSSQRLKTCPWCLNHCGLSSTVYALKLFLMTTSVVRDWLRHALMLRKSLHFFA